MYPREVNGGMMLYPMTEHDLLFMLNIRNEVRELLNDNRLFSLDECIRWYHKTQPENYIVSVSGTKVGVMRVRRDKQYPESIEVGGDIASKYRRKGYGLRAYNILISHLFNNPEVDELFLEVLTTNMAAFNLYYKLGFQIYEWKPQMAKRNNGWIAGFVMNLLRDKWE
jgi:RimJ/RimL family protein N-acetyltransferase